MIEGLLDIQELMPLFGYTDPRSFIKWCNTKKIPVIKLGIKKYVESHFLTQYIDNQLVIFVKSNEADRKPSEKETKTTSNSSSKYKSDNELVNKYLSKYESSYKSQITKKG